jgi:hypothetical protein
VCVFVHLRATNSLVAQRLSLTGALSVCERLKTWFQSHIESRGMPTSLTAHGLGTLPTHPIYCRTPRVLPADVVVMTAFCTVWTRADECFSPPTPTRSRTPGRDWADAEARWRWRFRWWIRSVPNVFGNITQAEVDDVVGVADTVVPNHWVINMITGYPQGLPWAPRMWWAPIAVVCGDRARM